MFAFFRSCFRAAVTAVQSVVNAVAEVAAVVVDCGREETAQRHAELAWVREALQSELAGLSETATVTEQRARLRAAESILWDYRRLTVRTIKDNTRCLHAVAKAREDLRTQMALLYNEAQEAGTSRARRHRCHEERHIIRPSFLTLHDHARKLDAIRDRNLAALAAIENALTHIGRALGRPEHRSHPLLTLRRGANITQLTNSAARPRTYEIRVVVEQTYLRN